MKRAFFIFKATSAILLKSIKMAEGWDMGVLYRTVSSAEKKGELISQTMEDWRNAIAYGSAGMTFPEKTGTVFLFMR